MEQFPLSLQISDMEREDLLRGRIEDLADTAYRRNIVTFTDFLDLYELQILHTIDWKGHGVSMSLFGGYGMAERQMAAFFPDALPFEWNFPLTCLHIEPLNRRFAEELTHRDFLGSILGLGIERCKLGDILVEEKEAWVFCQDKMADFICRELHSIRHTEVMVQVCPDIQQMDWKPKEEEITGSVASVRLDTVLALGLKASRSSILSLIEGGKVFVNGRLITTNAYHLAEGDKISVRGKGKFRYGSVLTQTKKGRSMIQLFRYM